MNLQWLASVVRDMAYQAGKDGDPELYAAVVTDNIPPDQDRRQLLQFIERPDWWAQLSTYVPEVRPYGGWFEKFRAEVIEALREMIEASPTPQGADTEAAAPDA